MSSGDLLADRRYRFGRDLAARGDHAGAADLFAQAVEAAPGFAPAWFALGEARTRLDSDAGAAAAFRRALELDPADACGAALQLARLGERDAATAMSPAYVRTLFDQYAGHFDAALSCLRYDAPARLREAIEKARPDAAFAHMLDLGCGTGLAGAAFRPLARRLTGVDLSPGMIAQARAKGLYDRLATGDLKSFLAAEAAQEASAQGYDLVIAADVFAYVSDLAPVAAAAASVLRGGGLFGFTVEICRTGVELGDKLRYRHSEDHVRTALGAARLRVVALMPISTRIEGGAAVAGLLILAVSEAAGQDHTDQPVALMGHCSRQAGAAG
jgi:predicted TPR repeat methyltransferase